MNLSYAYISTSLISIVFIFLGFMATLSRWKKRGGKELSLVFAHIFLASFCIFMEIISEGFDSKLFWRNVSQIGLFILPASTYNFNMVYTGEKSWFFQKMRFVNYVVAITCVILIFTNNYHHLMRTSVVLVEKSIGMGLQINQTIIGKISVALNTLMSLVGLVKLWVFMRRTSKQSRIQVRLVFIGFIIPILFTYLKSSITNLSGLDIPTPLSFLFGTLFILLGIYRYDFLSISPIARDWVLDEIDIGMIFTDPDGTIVDCNRFIQVSLEEDLVLLENLIISQDAWRTALSDCNSTEFEVEVERDSVIKTFQVKVHDLRKKNKSLGAVSLLQDITKEKAIEKKLVLRAEKDSLTHILNRASFEQKMMEILNIDKIVDQTCSFFMMDVDQFKTINDTYGHDTGDKVLREIAKIVRGISRSQDLVGRLGGDEFVMFLPSCDQDTAKHITERIHMAIDNFVFESPGGNFFTALSIGVTSGSFNKVDFNLLYKSADKALYQAKNQGRHRTCFLLTEEFTE